jgi:hypothetical protein
MFIVFLYVYQRVTMENIRTEDEFNHFTMENSGDFTIRTWSSGPNPTCRSMKS